MSNGTLCPGGEERTDEVMFWRDLQGRGSDWEICSSVRCRLTLCLFPHLYLLIKCFPVILCLCSQPRQLTLFLIFSLHPAETQDAEINRKQISCAHRSPCLVDTFSPFYINGKFNAGETAPFSPLW